MLVRCIAIPREISENRNSGIVNIGTFEGVSHEVLIICVKPYSFSQQQSC